jgi:hypothetical protein
MAQFTINLSLSSFVHKPENEEEEIFDNASKKPKGLRLSGERERESEIICCQSVLPLHSSSYLFKSSNETEIYFRACAKGARIEKKDFFFQEKKNIFMVDRVLFFKKLNEIESFNIFLFISLITCR